MESQANLTCQNLPTIFSSFVDTFVDFSVSGGLFLPPPITPKPQNPLQTIFPSPTRLIAIGDIHGDFQKSKESFKLAGLIDDHDKWCGGSTTVVQIGDVLDRGGEELKILYFLEKLKREAAKVNGNLITMNGNHEIMNVDGDFRYVTKEGLKEFQDWAMWYSVGIDMKKLCNELGERACVEDLFEGIPLEFRGVRPEYFEGIRIRIAALRPKGPISERFLSKNQTVVVVGDSVFVHGGLLPKHVDYGFENVNEEVRDWICGLKGRVSRDLVRGKDSIVWLRRFSNELAKDCDCSTLEHVLATIPGAKRMIMGHTIQESGINGVCGNQAIRIDVGMSKGCANGLPEVLEIDRYKGLRILTSNPLYQNGKEASLDAKRKDGLGFLLPELGPKQVEVKA
ncbi:hypothetical protein H5410_040172 [Solanum commersonii]|uniref:Calcineurin-like phosphoesterase domain-containing protein n=1 Tax=Solanum commersonii TaxID=4109 RepID=A0A9J5XPB5_SOLCO|nr:hypothetical protein H5410_040172 [Solanum commersonii]